MTMGYGLEKYMGRKRQPETCAEGAIHLGFARTAGDQLEATASLILLYCAGLVADDTRGSPEAKARAQRVIDEVLSAAHAGGYKQVDILRTLLARNELSVRTHNMTLEVDGAVGGSKGLCAALDRAGWQGFEHNYD